MRHPYIPLALVEYGEHWKGTLDSLATRQPNVLLGEAFTNEGAFVRKVLEQHCRALYTVKIGKQEYYGISIVPYVKSKSNTRFVRLGLLWYRPLELSVDFVKKLAEYLHLYPL
jgi:hypothetical protein